MSEERMIRVDEELFNELVAALADSPNFYADVYRKVFMVIFDDLEPAPPKDWRKKLSQAHLILDSPHHGDYERNYALAMIEAKEIILDLMGSKRD
jgi:hypothetical protein